MRTDDELIKILDQLDQEAKQWQDKETELDEAACKRLQERIQERLDEIRSGFTDEEWDRLARLMEIRLETTRATGDTAPWNVN